MPISQVELYRVPKKSLSPAGFGLRLNLYHHVLIFLGTLQIFPFLTKIGYGSFNTFLIALLPCLYLLIMFLLSIIKNTRKKLFFNWIDLLVLSFLFVNIIQIFNPYLNIWADSRYLEIGLRGFQNRAFYCLLYFTIRRVSISGKRFDMVAKVIAYSTGLSGVYALGQQFFGLTAWEAQRTAAMVAIDPLQQALIATRAQGMLGSTFTFGLMSAMGFICALYLVSNSGSYRRKPLILLSLIANGFGIYFSGSRSTYLSLLIICFILIMLTPWRYILSLIFRIRYFMVATLLVVILLLITYAETAPVKFAAERLQSLVQLLNLYNQPDAVTDVNFIVRRDLANATLSLIRENPFGYGSGIFTGGANPNGLVTVKGYATWIDNEFSALALETGILGVLLFLAIVAVSFRRCQRSLRVTGIRNQAIALAALLLVCPLAGFGGQWLTAYPANALFWAFVGIAANLPISPIVPNSQLFPNER